MSKSERLQVLLEPEQLARLQNEARRRRVPVAAVVRDAIDQSLDGDVARRRRAAEALRSAQPMSVPDDPADLEREINEMYDWSEGASTD